MSELTSCNYCTLQRIKREARERGERVLLRPAKGGGIECATHKPNEQPKKFTVWFMELTDHCVC